MTGEALSFNGLTHKYGARLALANVTMTIQAGEMFGLIGPDGAGKTTAIRLACGLLRPDGGGPSLSFPLRSGDLLVQGGTCQRTFEHYVPKRAHAGPRISVMFRQRGGN